MLIRSLFERGADGLHSSKKKIILPFVTQGTMEEEGNMSFAPHGRSNLYELKVLASICIGEKTFISDSCYKDFLIKLFLLDI